MCAQEHHESTEHFQGADIVYSELREINERLARIETKLQESPLPAEVGELKKTVYGTGDETYPGLKTRVDRLEQSEKRRVWIIRAAFGAIVTTIGGWLWQLVAALMKKT